MNYIFVIILLLFLIFMAYYNYRRSPVVILTENNENNEYTENFTSSISEESYNLISNSNFLNGQHVDQFINQNGYNKILSMKNPTQSPFVLHQKKNSFYEISCPVSINNNYILYFYLYTDGNIEEVNIEKYIKIRMPTQEYANYVPPIQYNIVKKVDIGMKRAWYYLKVNYQASNNVLDKQIIRFNNQFKDCSLYLTGISLYKVLSSAPNFIYNKDLLCYIDTLQYYSSNNILHDICGNNNDLYMSSIPKKNDDCIELGNTKIEGFPANRLNQQHFTINLLINKQENNNIIDSKIEGNLEKEDLFNKILLSVPGNNGYSFEIGVLDDHLYLLQDQKRIKSDKPLQLYNKTMITILYRDSMINIYADQMNIISSKVNSLYFSPQSIILNKNNNMSMYLYALIVYNRIIDTTEMKEIRNYFITGLNKQTTTAPSINDIQFDNIFGNKSLNNPFVKPFDKKIEKFTMIEEEMNGEMNEEIIDNESDSMKLSCKEDCDELCKKFLDGSESSIKRYKKCIQNCKYVLDSCNSYCGESKNQNSLFCKENRNKNKCPKVYKKNGKYIVYIPENSLYSDFFTGEKIFSSNIDKARNMYAFNFPDCPIPIELIKDRNIYTDKCPYVVNELNPCNTRFCADVKWDGNKPVKMNDSCKKIISNYCHLHYNQDDNCKCWDPKYKDSKACIQYRKYYENPTDYCKPSSFNIKDHPDFSKYIKKDNIPCWGCKIP